MEFKIGDKFTGTYPPEAAIWCNANNAMIVKLDSGEYEIQAVPEPPEPTVEDKNAQIAETRKRMYSMLIDPLHCEKIRKVALEQWTDEMESEYVAKVRELTEQIQTENPYLETGSENVQEQPESGSENVAE